MALSKLYRVLLPALLSLPGCGPQQGGETTAVAAEPRAAAARVTERPSTPASSFPFAGRDFRRDEEGYGGTARIIGSGDALRLVVALTFKGRPTCDLDGVLRAGAGGFTVETQDGPALTLRPTSRSGFQLDYADAGHKPYEADYCVLGTNIDGHYSLAGTAGRMDDVMKKTPYPACDDVRRAVASGDDAYDILEAHYPAALVNPASIDDTALDAGAMEALMRFTACTVHAGRGDGALVDQIAALFKSRRHASAAYGALSRIGRGSGAEAVAARALSEQMRAYASGPNG